MTYNRAMIPSASNRASSSAMPLSVTSMSARIQTTRALSQRRMAQPWNDPKRKATGICALMLFVLLLIPGALAGFPRGAGSGGGSSATVAAAGYATSSEVGQYQQITLKWTGSAPTGITSVAWSGGGGSGTVIGFSQTGPLVQFWTTVPASAGTYNLTVTPNNGASPVTISSIAITAPGNDLAAFPPGFIYGPATPMLGQGFGYRNNEFNFVPFATYFVRGLAGPPTMTLSDTSGHAGDAAYFNTTPMQGTTQAQYNAAFALCTTVDAFVSTKLSFFIDINITDGITTYTKSIVVQNPASNWATFYSKGIYPSGGGQSGAGNLVLDSRQIDNSGNVELGYIASDSGTATFTDPSGLFSFDSAFSHVVTIAKTSLIAANFGHYPVTITAPGGSPQTLDLYIGHDYQPVVSYVPNGTLYSSHPATNGFNSWPIGHFHSYSDAHGGAAGTTLIQNDILSDSSGVLQLWNQLAGVFLTGPISAGTINAQFKATDIANKSTTMVLALPVTAGTLHTGTLTGVVSPGLTNFVSYANRFSVNYRPSDPPRQVIALTESAFTPDWTLTQIDLIQGSSVSNAQTRKWVATGGTGGNYVLGSTPYINDGGYIANDFAETYGLTRYLLDGISGATANLVATNLSAIDHLTPKVDQVRITVTDGNGHYDTETFNLTINWCSNAASEIQVGPANANYPSPTYSNPYAMQTAMWNDYKANGDASTMACASVRLLRGITTSAATDTTGWDYAVAGGGSHFSGGYWPYPIRLFGDNSTQASFTGAISGTTLTVTGSSGVGIYPGDTISSGVGATKVMVMSQLSGTTHGNGTYSLHIGPAQTSATASISATAMTTIMPRVYMNFNGVPGSVGTPAPGGSQQGCIMLTGGFDHEIDGLEIANCSNAFDGGGGGAFKPGYGGTGAAFWTYDNDHGNFAIYNTYVYNSDNGILNAGFGTHVTLDKDMFMKNGSGGPGNHNIYISTAASFVMTNSVSYDVWRVHDVKTRAQYNRISNNKFADGINGLGSNPVEFTLGGDSVFDSNYVLKATNMRVEYNSITVQITPEIVDAGGTIAFAWPRNNIVVTNNVLMSPAPQNNDWQPGVDVIAPWGWPIAYQSPVYIDLTRNIPITATASNNSFWHSSNTGTGGNAPCWLCSLNGGVISDGGGNVTLATFPDSVMELIDPVTGTPPFHLPPPGAFSCCINQVSPYYNGSIASAAGTYGVMMTVPAGSTSGTAVTNGLLAATGSDWVEFSGTPTYSFVNLSSSNDNAKFTITPVGSGFQLYTNGTLCGPTCTPGVYSVEIQGVGVGYSYGNPTPITVNNVLAVVVGGFN